MPLSVGFVAWLWQYDETKRKCARSFSSAVRLLELYPQFTFVCSQVSCNVKVKCVCGSVAEWLGRWTCNQQVAVQILATPLSSATLGKLLTRMCLCHQAV